MGVSHKARPLRDAHPELSKDEWEQLMNAVRERTERLWAGGAP